MTTISNRGDIFAIANIIICELPVGKFFDATIERANRK